MRYLVTGAHGFVMSVFVRHVLENDPSAEIIGLDLGSADRVLERFLAPDAQRVRFCGADVTDRASVEDVMADTRPDIVVHGATVTHVPEWEESDPARFVDVNTTGTVHVVESAHKVGSVRRMVHVSSCAVYGAGEKADQRVPETAPLDADEMYGISKVAAEMVVRRLADLYGFPIPIVRLTKMFGPMERPSSARTSMSLPFSLARAHTREEPLFVTERTLRAKGDWLSASDVAVALHHLCAADNTGTRAYNLASGYGLTVPRLAAYFGRELRVSASEEHIVDIDPERDSGKDGVISPDRARVELEWTPRDMRRQVDDYLTWAVANPDVFATDVQ